MAIELVITALLVLANGFFVATEFSLARLRPTQVAVFEEQAKPGARSVRHAVEHIDAYLAACQLGITLASIGLGVVGKPVFADLLRPLLGDAANVAGIGIAGALAFAIITLLHVVVGELAPKSLAISRTGPTSLAVSAPMRVFYLVTRPLVDFFNLLGNLLLRPFGIPPARDAALVPHTENELRNLVRESGEKGLIDPHERLFTENVFTFGDRRTREVMMPRPEVDFLTTEQDARAAAERAIASGHTRLPVCEPEGGLDAPVGVLHTKDLLRVAFGGDQPALDTLARPLHRVSDSMLVDELLRELRRSRQHIALVVDEHGTTIGLVTLEDILEEIVGEIEDEFDEEADDALRHQDGAVLVRGSASLRLVQEELGVELPDSHEATVGGHVLETLGRLPQVGERVEVGGRVAEVGAVDDARILELRFDAPGDAPPDGREADGGD
jgi:CBS domain containing-hemolysin-like protein